MVVIGWNLCVWKNQSQSQFVELSTTPKVTIFSYVALCHCDKASLYILYHINQLMVIGLQLSCVSSEEDSQWPPTLWAGKVVVASSTILKILHLTKSAWNCFLCITSKHLPASFSCRLSCPTGHGCILGLHSGQLMMSKGVSEALLEFWFPCLWGGSETCVKNCILTTALKKLMFSSHQMWELWTAFSHPILLGLWSSHPLLGGGLTLEQSVLGCVYILGFLVTPCGRELLSVVANSLDGVEVHPSMSPLCPHLNC